jgi:hypothetical protein
MQYDDTEYPPAGRVDAALSGIAAQTAGQIADRARVPLKTAQKLLKKWEAMGLVERRGQRYRIDNAATWAEAKEPLPPLHVAHSITSGGPKGYTVTFPEPKPDPKPELAPDPKPDPDQIQKTDPRKARKPGQFSLFAG